MNKSIIIIMTLALAGCATPETVLRDTSGHVVTCGGGTAGSIAGGLIGYSIQKDHDADCIREHKAQGFTVIKHSDDQ